ncbi:S53 family peptidase [Variovorax sp. PBL-E5]|uniref:S53 family peptidase n=1 Tax=Variovorax sp. PBL-E5 TaxID=434014 RepID=UPI0013193634|nr:S53 family peptidase [Variovorax sp. PBL-E5]VTU22423.1 Pseudomonalisin precursor [Variovorax sp. PBL-E5]
MRNASKRNVVVGSEREPVPGAKPMAAIRADERFEVTVRVRPKAPPDVSKAGGCLGDLAPARRKYLSRDELAADHGADVQDLSKVAAFAKAHDLSVVESSVARRSVVLSGDARSMCAAFGVALHQFAHGGGTYRGRTGPISVPADLAPIVEGVFGLDNRPQAEPHFLRHEPLRGMSAKAASSFSPPDLARLYDFPSNLDGSGQCIGIVELGGGYRPADLDAYFGGLGIAAPTVKAVSVDHAPNHPTNANSADGEVMLDIEVAAAIAPKAVIAVYFAPNTSRGFLDALTTAVHDDANKPSVISISWGSAEPNWTAQAMTQFDQVLQAAASMGVTVCVAAGDSGSADGVPDGKPHVDFPASSPHALACGGTKLVASGHTIRSEVVWNEGAGGATGGGVSGFFALPGYQSGAHIPAIAGTRKTGRGLPDVAGDADPATGYEVAVDGQALVIGGTSAVAPLWAGLIALMNQQLLQPVGFLNPLLYGSLAGKGLLRDITSGSNGAYAAGPGWDACTGWGSVKGSALLAALAA